MEVRIPVQIDDLFTETTSKIIEKSSRLTKTLNKVSDSADAVSKVFRRTSGIIVAFADSVDQTFDAIDRIAGAFTRAKETVVDFGEKALQASKLGVAALNTSLVRTFKLLEVVGKKARFAALGFGGVIGAIAFVTDEQAKADAAIQRSIVARGSTFTATAKEVIGLATDLERVSRFSGTDLSRDLIRPLVDAGLSFEEVKTLAETAVNIATDSGKAVSAVGEALSKAIATGQVTELVTLTKEIGREQIEAINELTGGARRQAILELLTGISAGAVGNKTILDSIDQVKKSVENFLKAINVPLIRNFFQLLADGLNAVADFIEEHPFLGFIIGSFVVVGLAISALLSLLGVLSTFILSTVVPAFAVAFVQSGGTLQLTFANLAKSVVQLIPNLFSLAKRIFLLNIPLGALNVN